MTKDTPPTPQEAWHDMPIGPNLRQALKLSAGGKTKGQASEEEHEAFGVFLTKELPNITPRDQDHFVNLLEELVVMSYGRVAVAFMAQATDFMNPQDFRCMLNAGIAAMLVADWPGAESFLKKAQVLVPEEPAPYINLAQVLWQEERYDEGLLWVEGGLEADKNHQRLWELYAVFLKRKDEAGLADALKQAAQKRSAWAGLSLAAEVANARDPHLKVEWLKELYDAGQRGVGFLVEYTAAMGVAGLYQQVIDVVRAEDEKTDDSLAWQLRLHALQAMMALEDYDAAKIELQKLAAHPELPASVREAVKALEQDLAESTTKDYKH